MGRKPRWKESIVEDGVSTITFSSWRYFSSFIIDEMIDFPHYIWRGQKNTDWLLEPTLYRDLKKIEKNKPSFVNSHLEKFKYSVRGRRGTNPTKIETEDDWWSLGQHYGLSTPLLDWTSSPFVASFFAFEDEDNSTEYRTIYSIDITNLLHKVKESDTELKSKFHDKIIAIRPMQDENIRLVNQSGLFVKIPLGYDVENIVREIYKGEKELIILMKMLVPNKDRELCLRYLNKMNINHLTLFPDISGAASYTNYQLKIDKY